MSIRNKTKGTILASDIKIAKTLFEKTVGLIYSSQPSPLLLTTRFGIHTFGMKYPIDVLVLDPGQKVVKLVSSLPPNRIFLWNPLYNTVLELPAGTLKKTHTTLFDTLVLK